MHDPAHQLDCMGLTPQFLDREYMGKAKEGKDQVSDTRCETSVTCVAWQPLVQAGRQALNWRATRCCNRFGRWALPAW